MSKLNQLGIAILIALIFLFGVVSGYTKGFENGERIGWNNAMFIVALNPSLTNGVFIIDSNDHFELISNDEFDKINGTFDNPVCYKYR